MMKAVPIPLASGKIGWLHAGPTREIPEGYTLIKCAVEVSPPAGRLIAHDIGTKDFTPFEAGKLLDAIPDILRDLESGEPLYAGCLGGTGRTGTLLAILVGQHPAFTGQAAIAYVRANYKPHAVETPEQEMQVVEFSTIKLEPAAPFIEISDEDWPGFFAEDQPKVKARPWWKPRWIFG